VRTADRAAHADIVSQATGVPGQAVVKVTKTSSFGPIVKNYVFKMVPDTTLKSLSVNGRKLASFKPDVLGYHAILPAGSSAGRVDAVAADAAARVVIEQPDGVGGRASVTVSNGDARSVYTVDLDTAITGSDEFDSAQLGLQWRWVREDAARWRLSGGSLVVTSQSGDLQGSANTARNVALQDVNGDWTADSRLVFSRPLATNNEQGGIIAYADDDDYVKLAWEMADATAPLNKRRVVLVREQGGVPTTMQVTGADAQRIVGADGAIWFRLAKTGDTYKAYYSTNGSVYRFMGAAALAAEPTGAGPMAFNRAGASSDLDVAFDYFRIQSRGDPVPAPSG